MSWEDPEDGRKKAVPARAGQACDSDYLAGLECEVDAGEGFSSEIVDREKHFTASPRQSGGLPVNVAELAAYEQRDKVVSADVGHVAGGDPPTVSQHGSPVRDLKYLLQTMGDVKNPDT
jgi:hypothetical protein